jgi:ATP-dependent RNA helicase DDX5/DBP2
LQEHPDVNKRSEEEIKGFWREHQMTVKGDSIPRPITSFDEAGFPKYVYETLKQQNFTKPTCIQS